MKYKVKFQQLVDEECYEEALFFLSQYDIFKYEDSFYFSNMGWILNQLGRYLEASFYLLYGLKYYHDEAWLYAQYAYSLSKLKKYDEAILFFKKAIDMGMQETWIYIELGTCHFENQEFSSALLYFENALLDDSHNSWLLQQCARIYENQHNFELALEYYYKGFFLSYDQSILQDYIYLLIFLNRYDRAYSFLKNCDKNDVDIINILLAEICLYMNNLEEGLSYLENISNIDNLLYNLLYSQYCYLLKNTVDMNIHLKKFLRLLRSDHLNIALIKDLFILLDKTNGDYLKIQILLSVENLIYDKMWLYQEYIKSYSNIKLYRKAIKYCELYLNEFEYSKLVLDYYGWNLRLTKRNDEAINILLKRVYLYEEDEWILNELAINYVDIKDYKHAISSYEKLLLYDIDHLQCYLSLAWIYYKLENYIMAQKYLENAKNIGSTDDKILDDIFELQKNIYGGIEHVK